MAKRPNRTVWWLAAVLAAAVLGGVGLLGVPLWPYWVAMYHGEGADLRGAVLVYASLAGADLKRADLEGANLRRANLTGANLRNADLRGADLQRAYTQGADLAGADLRSVDLRGTVLLSDTMATRFSLNTNVTGARYDKATRWPTGFDPLKHGAILEK